MQDNVFEMMTEALNYYKLCYYDTAKITQLNEVHLYKTFITVDNKENSYKVMYVYRVFAKSCKNMENNGNNITKIVSM